VASVRVLATSTSRSALKKIVAALDIAKTPSFARAGRWRGESLLEIRGPWRTRTHSGARRAGRAFEFGMAGGGDLDGEGEE
jgi:hypothetical protein